LAESVRILIADRHPIFREGLRRLLETDSSFHIVAEARDNGAAAIGLTRQLLPDLLLLGMSPSAPQAVETLRELGAGGILTKTIVVTSCVDSPEVMRALQLGARGVVPNDAPPEALFNCIHSVMAGHFWIGHERVSEAVVGLRRLEAARRRSRAFGLTRRELEIIRAVVGGDTNKEIAQRSSISENTVKSHVAHVFDKLGASNRLELALFASHHRLLDGV
jgi:two-component system nitrate/nitrite response regulator NarL